MFSNLPKIPQLSPLRGIQTWCFVPNLSMFHLNNNRVAFIEHPLCLEAFAGY